MAWKENPGFYEATKDRRGWLARFLVDLVRGEVLIKPISQNWTVVITYEDGRKHITKWDNVDLYNQIMLSQNTLPPGSTITLTQEN